MKLHDEAERTALQAGASGRVTPISTGQPQDDLDSIASSMLVPMSLFITLHEIGHIRISRGDSTLVDQGRLHTETLREVFTTLGERLVPRSDMLRVLCREYGILESVVLYNDHHPGADSFPRIVDLVLEQPKLLEELACDMFAIREIIVSTYRQMPPGVRTLDLYDQVRMATVSLLLLTGWARSAVDDLVRSIRGEQAFSKHVKASAINDGRMIMGGLITSLIISHLGIANMNDLAREYGTDNSGNLLDPAAHMVMRFYRLVLESIKAGHADDIRFL